MLSGLIDTDREILLKLSDEDLLKSCHLNKYFDRKVCNDDFYIYYIAKMKEISNIIYKEGNPQLEYLKSLIPERVIWKNQLIENIENKYNESLNQAIVFGRYLLGGYIDMIKYFLSFTEPNFEDLKESISSSHDLNQNDIDEVFYLLYSRYVSKRKIKKKDLNILANEAAYQDTLEILKFLVNQGAKIDKTTLKNAKNNYYNEIYKYNRINKNMISYIESQIAYSRFEKLLKNPKSK